MTEGELKRWLIDNGVAGNAAAGLARQTLAHVEAPGLSSERLKALALANAQERLANTTDRRAVVADENKFTSVSHTQPARNKKELQRLGEEQLKDKTTGTESAEHEENARQIKSELDGKKDHSKIVGGVIAAGGKPLEWSLQSTLGYKADDDDVEEIIERVNLKGRVTIGTDDDSKRSIVEMLASGKPPAWLAEVIDDMRDGDERPAMQFQSGGKWYTADAEVYARLGLAADGSDGSSGESEEAGFTHSPDVESKIVSGGWLKLRPDLGRLVIIKSQELDVAPEMLAAAMTLTGLTQARGPERQAAEEFVQKNRVKEYDQFHSFWGKTTSWGMNGKERAEAAIKRAGKTKEAEAKGKSSYKWVTDGKTGKKKKVSSDEKAKPGYRAGRGLGLALTQQKGQKEAAKKAATGAERAQAWLTKKTYVDQDDAAITALAARVGGLRNQYGAVAGIVALESEDLAKRMVSGQVSGEDLMTVDDILRRAKYGPGQGLSNEKDQVRARKQYQQWATAWTNYYKEVSGQGSSAEKDPPVVVNLPTDAEVKKSIDTLTKAWFRRSATDDDVKAVRGTLDKQLTDAAYARAAAQKNGGTYSEPDAEATILEGLRNSGEYKSLFANKPGGQQEEEYANTFARATDQLFGGVQNDEAVRAGMRTGSVQTSLGLQAGSKAANDSSSYQERLAQAAQLIAELT